MKRVIIIVILLAGVAFEMPQEIDRDKLSLEISKADASNLEKLKAYLWKRESVATVNGEEKLSATADLNFNKNGELEVNVIDASTEVKQKRGIRGKVQASNAQSNLEYVEEALKLSIHYTYLSKGQMIDFFTKAELSINNGIIKAYAENVLIEGDNLTLFIEEDSKLFTHKIFNSFLGDSKDPISGEIKFEKFESGVSHAAESILNLPAKNAVIHAKNKDYSIRVL